MTAQYLFHVHNRAPAWRLVLAQAAPRPEGFVAADWTFTRAREAADVNPDVRRLCDETGYCLFKVGATFAELAREVG